MSRVVSRDPDRLVLFTDAVVAIAVTLLVLPLVDVVPDVVGEHGRSTEVITGHRAQIWSLLLSFTVIIRLWFEHHEVFQHIRGYTRALMIWNAGWLLTIVTVISYRNPDVASESDPPAIESVRVSLATLTLLAVGLAVVAAVPHASYYVLLLLFLERFAERFWAFIGV